MKLGSYIAGAALIGALAVPADSRVVGQGTQTPVHNVGVIDLEIDVYAGDFSRRDLLPYVMEDVIDFYQQFGINIKPNYKKGSAPNVSGHYSLSFLSRDAFLYEASSVE